MDFDAEVVKAQTYLTLVTRFMILWTLTDSNLDCPTRQCQMNLNNNQEPMSSTNISIV